MPTAAESQSVRDVTKQTRLSAQTVEAMRPAPTRTRIEHRDTGCPGLRLRVSQHGAKTWSVVYRVRGTGADGSSKGDPRRASLGAYPHIKLDKARALAREAMDAADEGRDWAGERKAAAETAKALEATGGRDPNCVEVLAGQFVERHAKRKVKEWRNVERWLQNVVVPEWRERPIQSIRRADVQALLDKVVRERTPAAALEVRKHLSAMFNWVVDRDEHGLTASPMFGLKRPERYVPRDNKLTRAELRRVWDAAGDLGYPFREMFRLLILTGQRRSEVAELQVGWLFERQDCGRGVRVPAAAYKTGKTHEYPLSAPAAAIVKGLPRHKAGPYLLSGMHSKSPPGKAPVSGFSKAKDRLDRAIAKRAEKAREEGVELPPMPTFTVHDIRRSVATGMAEIGVSVEHIERVLGHELGGVAGTYNVHDYFAEKLAALELWGRQWS
ncbi:DUF4102 domain-containing protein [Sphingomonas gilva]|uniref:DUF4102 domain-containing protein n=1 Tax=Sphingomonas gilva TaxID=2305907 RepID=A0A396RVG4_9SPHN|nr:integrase family protein [Sphingomonas gilva]RHW17661.1 DUF4102 domain-containing protein [Sphingomonas gilva]